MQASGPGVATFTRAFVPNVDPRSCARAHTHTHLHSCTHIHTHSLIHTHKPTPTPTHPHHPPTHQHIGAHNHPVQVHAKAMDAIHLIHANWHAFSGLSSAKTNWCFHLNLMCHQLPATTATALSFGAPPESTTTPPEAAAADPTGVVPPEGPQAAKGQAGGPPARFDASGICRHTVKWHLWVTLLHIKS